MSVIDRPNVPTSEAMEERQRFVFHGADWELYEVMGRNMPEQRSFITFYKGRLEVVTVGYTHERIVGLISTMVRTLAEETGTEITNAGMSTLRRKDLQEGVEPDSSFYTAHQAQMCHKKEIDLTIDPPPDLAIEVEVTRRLAERRTIYRDIGVPEIWVYNDKNGLTVHCRKGEKYELVDRSPTFGQLSPKELSEFISAGLGQGETGWLKSFRKRVRDAIDIKPS